MRNRKTILLLALMLLAAACSPLRKMQRRSITDSTSLDRSEIRKAITDVLHEWGTLSQTVVEMSPTAIHLTAITDGGGFSTAFSFCSPCRRTWMSFRTVLSVVVRRSASAAISVRRYDARPERLQAALLAVEAYPRRCCPELPTAVREVRPAA